MSCRYNSMMANRLRELRERGGLSQKALGESVGTSQEQIQRLETGERKLTVEWAKRLAGPLGCYWVEIIEEMPHYKPDEEALVSLYRRLSEDQRGLARSLVTALAERATDTGDDDDDNQEKEAG